MLKYWCRYNLVDFREKYYSDEQVLKHYQMCAEVVWHRILIHEMPFISGHGGHTMNWPISLLDKLADIPNIIAIKEDAKNDDYSHEVIRTIKIDCRLLYREG